VHAAAGSQALAAAQGGGGGRSGRKRIARLHPAAVTVLTSWESPIAFEIELASLASPLERPQLTGRRAFGRWPAVWAWCVCSAQMKFGAAAGQSPPPLLAWDPPPGISARGGKRGRRTQGGPGGG